MKDSAALSAQIWNGALQAAATMAATTHPPGQYNPDQAAERILDLAVRIIRKLPEYDSKIGATVSAAVLPPR